MTLFFSYEEVQNTPRNLLRYRPFQVLSKALNGAQAYQPIYQIERKQPKTILRRGEYYLPPHNQHIQWDFLPTEISHLKKLHRKVLGFREAQSTGNNPYPFLIRVDGADWRKFFDEESLRTWARAYAIGLPEKIGLGEFTVQLPENENEMLPLDMVSRCKGVRGSGEHRYRCHRRAWHGGWCLFIAPHRGVSCQ